MANRTLYQGDYIPIVVEVTDTDGRPLNLAGRTVRLYLGEDSKLTRLNPNYTAWVTARLVKDLTVTDAQGGKAEGTLMPEETKDFVGDYVYKVTVTGSDGVEETISVGKLKFWPTPQ